MFFNAIRENKILAKISEYTVHSVCGRVHSLIRAGILDYLVFNDAAPLAPLEAYSKAVEGLH